MNLVDDDDEKRRELIYDDEPDDWDSCCEVGDFWGEKTSPSLTLTTVRD